MERLKMPYGTGLYYEDGNENGKLTINSLDLDIFIADLFCKCKTRHEVEWIEEILESCVGCGVYNRLLDLEEEK